MTSQPKVSIIMPVFGTEKYIKASIESVLAQDYQNWELVIVNDCSKDKCEEIILGFDDSRIKYIKNEKNSGALVTRNNAMKNATGDYIAFLDSDDLWKKEKLSTQIEFMQKNNYDFSCTNYEHIDENSKALNTFSTAPKKITAKNFMRWNWCGCLTVMYNAKKLGKFYLENYKMRDDWALWIKISKKSPCYLLDESLAYYRVRTGSQSTSGTINLLKQHYRIFRFSEKMGRVKSLSTTLLSLFGFFLARKKYRRKVSK